MPMFLVSVDRTFIESASVEIEADDSESARDLAEDMVASNEVVWDNGVLEEETYTIEEIEE